MIKVNCFNYRKGEAGFSLIELMIAMALGLVLLLGITTVVVNSSRSYTELTKASQRIENGRYAMDVLANDIRHAGFYGQYPNDSSTIPTTLPNPCATTMVSMRDAMSLPVQGYDFAIDESPAVTPSPLSTCISDRQPGTDVLVIRRVSTEAVPVNPTNPAAVPTLQPNRVYLQATAISKSIAIYTEFASMSASDRLKAGRFGLGGGGATFFDLKRPQPVSPFTPIPLPIYPFEVNIYFVRSWSATAGDGIPTLCRAELTAGTAGATITTVPLVEGVENLQFEYGIDSDPSGMGYGEVDPRTPGGTDYYVTNPASAKEWSDVMVVRLYLLVRSLETTLGYSDSNKVYDLGVAGTVTGSGSFKRHVFNTVVRLNNSSMRREKVL